MLDPDFDPLSTLEQHTLQINHLMSMMEALVQSHNNHGDIVKRLIRDNTNLVTRLNSLQIRVELAEKELLELRQDKYKAD